jgi:hypothetical protein
MLGIGASSGGHYLDKPRIYEACHSAAPDEVRELIDAQLAPLFESIENSLLPVRDEHKFSQVVRVALLRM